MAERTNGPDAASAAQAPGHLDKFRPGAIVTAKSGLLQPAVPADGAEPGTAGGSTTFSRTPGPRVTVQNKSGKAREIAKIEPPGKVGDFYDFGSILGRGGFGTVTEILHAKTFEPFAGKVIEKSSLESINAQAEDSFRRVMETFLNNEHFYVVKMLHIFEDESNYYQVMDSCQGGTLRRFVRSQEVIPVSIMEHIFEQVCTGIAFLHGLQMLHRDIKPDNVMLVGGTDVGSAVAAGTKRIRLNLVDFDMCQFMDANSEASTGHIEGTPGYIAPEVLVSTKYSKMTDLFAFGCLMYFVLRNEEPGPKDGGFDSQLTGDLLANVNRWAEETAEFCNSIDPDRPRPKTPASGFPSEPSSARSPLPFQPLGSGCPPTPTSLCSPTSLQSDSDRGDRGDEMPIRLWKLMAWCVQQDPRKRPQRAEEVLFSGLIRSDPNGWNEPGSPMSAQGSMSPKDKKKKKEKKEKRGSNATASISDLLKLG